VAEVAYVPSLTVPLSDPVATAAINKLIDALEEHEDVKDVHSNAEFPDEVAG
jgi:transcriptional/translational regulatory protein YebC/TACO1